MMRHRTSAFSLVEVTLALAIAAFALLAIFGLLPVGLNSNRNALEQTTAANIASGIAADLRATPAGKPTTPLLQLDLANGGTYYLEESGGPYPASKTLGAGGRYRVVLTITPPAAQRRATGAHLSISWPAAATPENASGSLGVYLALDRN